MPAQSSVAARSSGMPFGIESGRGEDDRLDAGKRLDGGLLPYPGLGFHRDVVAFGRQGVAKSLAELACADNLHLTPSNRPR